MFEESSLAPHSSPSELPEGETRSAQIWNRAFFREIFVKDGKIIRFEYEEPFASLLGSHNGQIVEERGRYSNLPKGRLYALRMLADGDFANGIQELHSLLSLSKKDGHGRPG